jgi:hypothetical protein
MVEAVLIGLEVRIGRVCRKFLSLTDKTRVKIQQPP